MGATICLPFSSPFLNLLVNIAKLQFRLISLVKHSMPRQAYLAGYNSFDVRVQPVWESLQRSHCLNSFRILKRELTNANKRIDALKFGDTAALSKPAATESDSSLCEPRFGTR